MNEFITDLMNENQSCHATIKSNGKQIINALWPLVCIIQNESDSPLPQFDHLCLLDGSVYNLQYKYNQCLYDTEIPFNVVHADDPLRAARAYRDECSKQREIRHLELDIKSMKAKLIKLESRHKTLSNK